MLDRLFTIIIGSLSYIFFPIYITCNLLLISLGVHGTSDKLDIEKYHTFKKVKGKAVIIFNHPTFFDHIVIMKELNDTPRFAMSEKYIIGPIKWIAKHFNVIPITSTKGNSASIQDAMIQRPPPIVAPAGGYCHPTDIAELESFKTGAFIGSPYVLPIVIHYTPYEPWPLTSTMIDTIIKRFFNREPLYYTLKVLDPVTQLQDESPADFAQRCRVLMKDALTDLQNRNTYIQPYNGSPLCFTTSFLFLISSIITIQKGMEYSLYAGGMLMVFVTSILYHGTGDNYFRKLDIISNIFWAGLCSIPLIMSAQIVPMIFLSMAICGYISKANHAFFVHIPIVCGFLAIQ